MKWSEESGEKIQPKYDDLLLAFSHRRYVAEAAAEYARHRFLRRLGTLVRCINNVFDLVPRDCEEVPDRNTLHDAQINLQAFYSNTYECLDNLAWVWVHEKGLAGKIHRNRVGLRAQNRELRATLSDKLQACLQSLDPWLESHPTLHPTGRHPAQKGGCLQ